MDTATNVDISELAKFGDIAHQWWDPNGPFKPLHQINPLRLNWIQSHAVLKDAHVIDVGCGGGILSESMVNVGAQVVGIDLSEKPLQVARLHAYEHELTMDYRLISVEAMAEAHPQSFDVVTCLEMLEHVPDPASVVTACAKLVKPGGKVFFSTLNRTTQAFLMAIVGAEHILRMLPVGTHDYHRFIKPAELRHVCEVAGLQWTAMVGLAYNPFTGRYFLKDGHVGVNYMVACEKIA